MTESNDPADLKTNPGASREVWDGALRRAGIDPSEVAEYNVPDLSPVVIKLTRTPLITPGEAADRRYSVQENRANLRLEGLTAPPAVTELEERFMRGELTPAEFRQACFDYAKSLAPDKNWEPITPPLAAE